jgi:hypothetical protein
VSNAGQAALGIVGAVIGFYVGGPQGAVYGFQLGYLAGTALFPTQLPHLQGPRLGEGQQTQSTVGNPIPMIFGTQPVAGNIIWASPIREVANDQTSGKGAPEQTTTTYTYYRSFAILLCEGPIAGVRRIWANGKLVYDRTNSTGVPLPDLPTSGLGAILGQFLASQFASAVFAQKMTIYLGTEDQLPDPVIESFEGVGNVPAHRGYAYVVFDDVELKPEDGNRIPAQWKFEVYEEGDDEAGTFDYFSNEVLYPWVLGFNDPRWPGGVYRYQVPDAVAWYDSAEEVLALYGPNAGLYGLIGWNRGDIPENVSPFEAVDPTTKTVVNLHYPRHDYDLENGCYTCIPSMCAAATPEPGQWWVGGVVPSVYVQSASPPPPGPSYYNCGLYYAVAYADYNVSIQRRPQAPADPCDFGVPAIGLDGYCVVNGVMVPQVPWTLDTSTNYRVLQEFAEAGADLVAEPLNPARPVGHAQYSDQSFWEDAYELAVLRGTMEPGLVYGVDYPNSQAFGYRIYNDIAVTETQPVSLASIIRRLCARVGITDIDVDDLEATFVIGYQIPRPMAARGAIEPLRSVGFFDVVESGTTLKFVVRGKPLAATLLSSDLGAHLADEERPPSVSTKKTQPFELPRQVRVHFQNPALDYDPGEELSPARFDTPAQSVLDVDLAVCISSTFAAQIAETLYRDFWASRWAHGVQVNQEHARIEPADVVGVPVDGRVERMRINNLTDRLPILRMFELVRDDDGTYVSYAEGTSTSRPPTYVAYYGPVDLLLMDLPALADADDNAGIYAASYPIITDGSFRGALFLRSDDGGGSYPIVGGVTSPVAAGVILSAIPSGPTTIFDLGNTITVELAYGTLENRTEADVLGGANAAAVGIDGRWEIVQFLNATLVAGTVWTLSGLLRGRRGTEAFVTTSVAGDQFVMLSTGALTRLPLNVGAVGLERLYKAIPIGTSPEAVTAEPFTGRGVALKPFSPVHVEGTRDVDGNLTITWLRRDRLGSDLVVPMSETIEDYEVDILDIDDTVLRTISVTAESATYTDAQQITDFGSVQASVAVRVMQISTTVGRGTAAEALV